MFIFAFAVIMVCLYSLGCFIVFVKKNRLLKSKKIKAFEQGLKEKLPKLFNKDNWRVISEERVCYKPTGEDFSWVITYLDDLVLMFPIDIERQMKYDEQMILFNFLNELTTNAFKNGSWDDRKDLIRKYG
jgi:hypothetical protein